jgi:hypothetical protein
MRHQIHGLLDAGVSSIQLDLNPCRCPLDNCPSLVLVCASDYIHTIASNKIII